MKKIYVEVETNDGYTIPLSNPYDSIEFACEHIAEIRERYKEDNDNYYIVLK